MTYATRSVAVVATQLPTTDRRALSQAWYSALHVSQAQTAPVPPKAAGEPPAHAAALAVRSDLRTPASRAAAPSGCAARSARRVEPAVAGTVERRAPATNLSQRIERALRTHIATVPVQPAAMTIKAADGRVQLLVRHDGKTTRVIALCVPHLRANVDRALARARFALTAAGTPIEAA